MAGWVSLDTQTAKRRNREWIATRLIVGLYDVNEAGTKTVTPVRTKVALGTAIGDVWAVPAGIAVALGLLIKIVNTDSVVRTASVYLIEPSQTAASVARTIFNDEISPGEHVAIRIPYTLAASATIRGLASAASVVTVHVHALTLNAQLAGVRLRVIEGVALTASLATLYTCNQAPFNDVEHAILLSATLCNTDAVLARRPEVHLVPSAGSAGVSNQIWKSELFPRETGWSDDGDDIEPGDFIQAKASVTDVVSARLTILEALVTP